MWGSAVMWSVIWPGVMIATLAVCIGIAGAALEIDIRPNLLTGDDASHIPNWPDSILFSETSRNTFTCLTVAQRMCTSVPSHPIEDLNHCLGQHFDRCVEE